MALTTYADLQAQVAAWLNRGDLSGQIPDFITLAEARLRRELRRTTVVNSAFSVNAASVALPAGAAELRSIRLLTSDPSLDTELKQTTFAGLADIRAAAGGVSGRPTHYAQRGQTLHFAPTPDRTYTAEIAYFAAYVPVSTSTALLLEAPDLLLYGALCESAPYLQHDERIPVWERRFREALDALNKQRQEEEHSGALRPARLPRVF